MFRIGQKVVCVDDSTNSFGSVVRAKDDGQLYRLNVNLDGLKKGEIYTVIGFCDAWYGDEPCLILAEIKRFCRGKKSKGFQGFKASRFRPVVERKNEAGMEILKKLLIPANHKHLEGV